MLITLIKQFRSVYVLIPNSMIIIHRSISKISHIHKACHSNSQWQSGKFRIQCKIRSRLGTGTVVLH